MKRAALFLLLAVSSAALAEPTRYVSDQLVITMRTGKGNQYQILQTLRSGVQLELLEDDGTYSHIRTPKGLEGWVLSQYLVDQPVAKTKLATALDQLDAANKRVDSLQARIKDLEADRNRLRGERGSLSENYGKVKAELEQLQKVAARPAQLNAENQRMKERIASLEAEAQKLAATNNTLKDRSRRDWFLTGAGVLGGGILLGLLLPLLRRRRADSGWGDLR